MSRTIDKARYVRRITTEDIALVMAELHSIVICDPKRGKHVDGDAAGALEAMAELSLAVRVWADAQKKIEKANQIPVVRHEASSITPQMKAAALKSSVLLA